VTHSIRIAMKYHSRSGCKAKYDSCLEEENEETAEEGVEEESEETAEEGVEEENEEEEEEEGGRRAKSEGNKKSFQGPSRKELIKQDAADVNAKLDFTLNCNSVRLTSRDASLKTATRTEKQ